MGEVGTSQCQQRLVLEEVLDASGGTAQTPQALEGVLGQDAALRASGDGARPVAVKVWVSAVLWGIKYFI